MAIRVSHESTIAATNDDAAPVRVSYESVIAAVQSTPSVIITHDAMIVAVFLEPLPTPSSFKFYVGSVRGELS